ncbi:30S ribosome-binding factor RbfA [Synechococcus sp. R60.4]|uniref:30S ribosome-binding factor RbfA n=1 Tax=unclassified Synechococcus TaxID=2626047 RepID=UPI0039C3E455
MATARRVARVAELIKREVSQILLSEIKDDRVGAGMVSIVDVEVSNDLQNARIFVSIYGDEAAQQQTMEGLASATPFVRREIGQRLGLRRVPTVVFLQDRSLERGSRVLALLNQLRQPAEAQQQEGSHPGVEGRMADTPGGEEDELSEQE